MKKLYLRLPGRLTYIFWDFDFLIFPTFKQLLTKFFTKKPPGFKKGFESTDKVLPLHQYLWSEISRQWNNVPLNSFWNLHGRAFCFLYFYTSKMYCGLFQWEWKFHRWAVFKLRAVEYAIPLFSISHLQCFSRNFYQKVYEETILFQLKFQKSISRCSILQKIRMSNFVVLKWWLFGAVFPEIKKCGHSEFSWIKYFGNDSHKMTYMGLL